ncbi:TPA: nuclear transport factor 2 family protein, partial [Acinetobacter baumannii]
PLSGLAALAEQMGIRIAQFKPQ